MDNLPLTDLVTTNGLQFSYLDINGNTVGAGGVPTTGSADYRNSLSLRGVVNITRTFNARVALLELVSSDSIQRGEKMMRRHNPKGFALIYLIFIMLALGGMGAAILFLYRQFGLHRTDRKRPQPGLPVGLGRG